MPIRDATTEDLHAIGSLARGDRLMRQSWDPLSWPDVAEAGARHDLWIRRLLADPGAIALVAAGPAGAVDGVLIARPARLDAGVWVIEEFIVASLLMWPTAGRALLAAAGGRLARWGGAGFALGCPPNDHAMASILEAAGLQPAFRFRIRSLGAPAGTLRPTMPLPAPVLGPEPLPHSLSTSPGVGTPIWCSFGGAQALLGPRRWAQRGGTVVGVTDPVISSGFVDVDLAVVELVERHLRTIGIGTSIVVSPGHGVSSLDVALDQLGYADCMDWWTTAPTSALMLEAPMRRAISN